MVICIVPMKERSERLPHKNLISLGGKPLCWHLLNTLAQCHLVDRLVVDTDSETIATCVRAFKLNIDVDLRPAQYRGDDIHGNTLIGRYVTNEEDIYVQCHITSPFLLASSLEKAISAVTSAAYENAFSVTEMHQRGWLKDRSRMIPLNHDSGLLPLRTQEIQPLLVENGAFFVFQGDFYLRNHVRNGAGGLPISLTFPETVDIDTRDDLSLAELIINAKKIN
jgi:CMP-N-acetylneuraminic acid synthetase